MKKILVMCLFMVAVVAQVEAQDETKFEKATIKFIKLTGASDFFEKAINQIGGMVLEEKKEIYKKEVNSTLNELYIKIAELYMKEFTHSEVKKLVVFYETSLGKKLAKKQMLLSKESMTIGQSWGMEAQAIAKKYSKK